MIYALLKTDDICSKPGPDPTPGIVRNMNWLVILMAAILALVASHAQSAGPQRSTARHGQTYTRADVDPALEKARDLRSVGKYEQALKLHIWYHKNALEFDPAHASI